MRENRLESVDFSSTKLTDNNKRAIVSQNFSTRFGLLRRFHLHSSFLCLVLSFLFASCRPSTQDRPPGYLVAGIESYPLQLDPRYATDANSVRIGNLIYNSLLRANEKAELRPELAENWRTVDDRTYIFDLRKDAGRHEIDAEVRRMQMSPINAWMTRLTFRFMLLKSAYTHEEIQRMAAASRFRGCEIARDGIGFELRLTKAR